MLPLTYLCIFVLYLCFTPASSLDSFILMLYSYFSGVYVRRLTGLVECVEKREGLRRDGAWEHGLLQQRVAGEATLHEPPHVCVLMHVGAAQARTGMRERQRVSPAEQVREMHAARVSHDALLPDLVSLRIGEEDARREYMQTAASIGGLLDCVV